MPDEPYIGPHYHTDKTRGLIVLLATYGNTTRQCMNWFVGGKWDYSFYWLFQGCFDEASRPTRQEITRDRAVMNYIDQVLPQNQDPTEQDYLDSEESFKTTLSLLNPKAVWLLGQAHYEPRPGGFIGSAEIVRQVLEIEPVCSWHPAATIGKRWILRDGWDKFNAQLQGILDNTLHLAW